MKRKTLWELRHQLPYKFIVSKNTFQEPEEEEEEEEEKESSSYTATSTPEKADAVRVKERTDDCRKITRRPTSDKTQWNR
jgi:hypothetical protein